MNLRVMSALIATALGPKQEAWLGTIPTLVTEALNQIQQKRSFNCMKLTIDFSLSMTGPGPFTYALPATFKESQSGVNTLRASNETPYGSSLWRLYTRQEVNRLQQIGVNVAERTAFLEQAPSGIWSIYFPGPLDAGTLPPDTMFSFDTYSFLDPVSDPADENDLMRRYPMLVIETAKFLVFSLGSDEESIAAKNEAARMINGDGTPKGWVGYFPQASADDNSHTVRGRTSRMGGF